MNKKINERPPAVFISYIWTTPQHEKWVYSLAERLRAVDGIDVKLDKWDLREGYGEFVGFAILEQVHDEVSA